MDSQSIAFSLHEIQMIWKNPGRQWRTHFDNVDKCVWDQKWSLSQLLLVHCQEFEGAQDLTWKFVLQVTRALKGFYDNDIVLDAIILGWHKNPGVGKALGVEAENARLIRKSCRQFAEWLEEEDESEEESDDEE